jgi:hypothetical protein
VTTNANIVITYRTIDRFYERRTFKTLAGARRYARKRLGTSFDVGGFGGYAVDGFGTGTLRVTGVSLDTLLELGRE